MIEGSGLSFSPRTDEFRGTVRPAMQTRDIAAEETPNAIGTRLVRVRIHETVVWVNIIIALPRSEVCGCFVGAPADCKRRSAPRQDLLDIENSLPNGTSSPL
jgi:hypothetical protein